jgi:hypothetical protein
MIGSHPIDRNTNRRLEVEPSQRRRLDSASYRPILFLGGQPKSGVVMRTKWTPSIVPGQDQDVCLVIDDLGPLGLIYCESDVETANVENVVQDLLDGQYSNPVRVICFNVAEGWSLDISADVAAELRRRCDLQVRDVPSSIQDFVERYYEGRSRQLSLRLI